MSVKDEAPLANSRSGVEEATTLGEDASQLARAVHPKKRQTALLSPKVLLTDTDRRPYAARLAIALTEAGCRVSAICSTDGHPLLKTPSVERIFHYSSLAPLVALRRAIEAAQPDLIVPCDDRGVRHLHELHAALTTKESDHALLEVIRRSLGAPESYSVVSGRYDLLQIASEEGLRVPATFPVHALQEFKALEQKLPFPWVLKADETWGGRGVRIAHSLQEAEQQFPDVHRPFRFRRAVKRMIVNRDPFWLQPWWRGRRPAVIAQGYVQGRPANCGVFCWEGKIVAGIAVEVVASDGDTGPASVVRVVDSPDMMLCAERLARRLRLSGFFGLDFMIEEGTGNTYLIEMNPRTTPVCHLRLGAGRDMIGGLWAQLSGQPDPMAPAITEKDLVAYFPQAWNANPALRATAFGDVPTADADLMREFLNPWPQRSLLFRLTMRMHR